MREFHADTIQCVCVTAVSGIAQILLATSQELILLTGQTLQEEVHCPHTISTHILSLTPILHQTRALLRTAESLQLVSFADNHIIFCQCLSIRFLACCAVRDWVYVVTKENRQLAVHVFNLHTSRSSFTLQQTLLLPEDSAEMPSKSEWVGVLHEKTACQGMANEACSTQIATDDDSSFVVVAYGNSCHLLANNKGALEVVAKTRTFSEPIIAVCFTVESFYLVTSHAIVSVTPWLQLLHPVRSVLTSNTPVTRLPLSLFQQILATPHPVVSAANLLTLLLLQQWERLESVLQLVVTVMTAEAEKVKEAWKWQLEDEKEKGSVSFSHTFVPLTCHTITCGQLDSLLSLFDVVSIEEFSSQEEKDFKTVIRIYRRLKPFQENGYIDLHGIRFLLVVLLLNEDLLPTASIPYSAVLEGCLSESKDALAKEACVFLLKKELHVEDVTPSQSIAAVASPPPVEGKYSALFSFSSNRYRDIKVVTAPVAEAFDPEEWESRVTWKQLKACHFVLWQHNQSTCSHIALKCAMVGRRESVRHRMVSSSPAARSRRRSSCWR